jgi:hypothetical protein
VENRSRPEIRTHSRMSMGWTRCPYPDNSESGSLNVSRNKLVRPSLKTLVQGPDNDSELPQLFLFCSALVLLQFQRFRWAIKLVRQVLRLWSPTTLSPNLVERKRELLRCVKEKKPILPWMKIIARVNSKKARLARKDSRDENPNSNFPPPTDHGNIEPVWCSFDLTRKRVQGGGWTNQATQRESVPSKDIAGVRMRLTAGSFRELHWRTADEWVFVLYGNARVTVLNPDGTIFIGDVGKGDLCPQVSLTRFRDWDLTALNSCWCSIKVRSQKTTPSCSPTGSLLPGRDPRIIASLLRRKEIVVETRNAQFLHPEVKRRSFHSQARGSTVRTGDNPAGLLESLENVVALCIFQGNCSE